MCMKHLNRFEYFAYIFVSLQAYDIVIAGTLMCSKRFSEFVSLNEQLKRTFLGFSFPKVPPKWPFK